MSAIKTRLRSTGRWLRKRIEPARMPASDKQVLRALAYAFWTDDTVAMNRQEIARRTGLHLSTVYRATTRLQKMGLLQVVEKGRISGGRRYRQVYRIPELQVTPRGCTVPPPSTSGPLTPSAIAPNHPLTAAFPHVAALFVGTTTRQPLPTPHPTT